TGRLVTEVEGEKYSPVVRDGSEDFHSPQIHCPHGLPQRQANGESHYSPLVVGATVTQAGRHALFPVGAEEVRQSEEQEPQDCELTAAKRLGKRLRTEHRQLALCLVGDDL